MSLLLAHIIRGNAHWENARLTVFCAEERYRSEGGRKALAREIKDDRIDADLTILSEAGPHTVAERSAESELVYLPFRFRRDEIISLAGSPAVKLLRWVTSTVLIQAAEDIDLDAEPESGEAAERAEARDALEEAKRRAGKAAKDTQAAAEKVESTLAWLTDLMASARDTDAVREAERGLQQARQESERAARRAGAGREAGR